MCHSLSHVIKERQGSKAPSVVTSPKERREGRKFTQTYRLAYPFRNVPSQSKRRHFTWQFLALCDHARHTKQLCNSRTPELRGIIMNDDSIFHSLNMPLIVSRLKRLWPSTKHATWCCKLQVIQCRTPPTLVWGRRVEVNSLIPTHGVCQTKHNTWANMLNSKSMRTHDL